MKLNDNIGKSNGSRLDKLIDVDSLKIDLDQRIRFDSDDTSVLEFIIMLLGNFNGVIFRGISVTT